MPAAEEYRFDRSDLAKVLGVRPNTIAQHIKRGYVSPNNLASLTVYLAHYGPRRLRERIVIAAIEQSKPADPGGWKKRAAAKRRK